MKVTIECVDRNEGDRLRAALDDPATRATLNILGLLMALPTREQRVAVMAQAADHLRATASGDSPRGHINGGLDRMSLESSDSPN